MKAAGRTVAGQNDLFHKWYGLLYSLCGSAADSSIIILSVGHVNWIEGFGRGIFRIWNAKLLLFWLESDIIDRRLYSYKSLGHRQAVRHRTLTPALEGSNPAGPATKKTRKLLPIWKVFSSFLCALHNLHKWKFQWKSFIAVHMKRMRIFVLKWEQ